MARYYGNIGYAIETEKYPGTWVPTLVPRPYYGDVIKNRLNSQQQTSVNPTITISNTISIIADPFAYENFINIRYAEYLGKKWIVTSIEVDRPRMLLTLGGLYNG